MIDASILIVDDDEIDRYLLKRFLGESSYTFEIFEEDDGSTALAFLKNHEENRKNFPSAFPPLIIFLDVNMPIMRGPEFLPGFSEIRGEINAEASVIMMFSSSERKEDRDAALHYTFVKDYLVKGTFDATDLGKRVEQVIVSHRAST